jgi:hypothetical protein
VPAHVCAEAEHIAGARPRDRAPQWKKLRAVGKNSGLPSDRTDCVACGEARTPRCSPRIRLRAIVAHRLLIDREDMSGAALVEKVRPRE